MGWGNHVLWCVAVRDSSLQSKRSLDVDTIKEVRKYKEVWRFKVKHLTAKPREVALGHPFSDPEIVKEIGVTYDPFELDYNFPEVDSACLQPADWHFCFNTRMNIHEHITIFEGTGLLRYCAINCGQCDLSPRATCTWVVTWGWSFRLRRVGPMRTACNGSTWDAAVVFRGEKTRSRKQMLTPACIPTDMRLANTVQPKSLARSQRGSSSRWSEEVLCSTGSEYAEGQHQGRAQGEAHSVCKGEGSKEGVPGSNVARTRGRFRKSRHRLPTSIQRVPGVCESLKIVNSGTDQLGQCLRRISELYVSRRSERRKGLKVDSRKIALLRAKRCLQGWHLLDPPQNKAPLPFPLVALLVQTLLDNHKVLEAVSIMRMFVTSYDLGSVRASANTIWCCPMGAVVTSASTCTHSAAKKRPRWRWQTNPSCWTAKSCHFWGFACKKWNHNIQVHFSHRWMLRPSDGLGSPRWSKSAAKIPCGPSSTLPLRSKLQHAD